MRFLPTLALLVSAWSSTAQAYIDPNTTQTVVSSLGGLIAALGTAFVFAGVFVRAYLRKAVDLLRAVAASRLWRRSVRPIAAGLAAMFVAVLAYGAFQHFFLSEGQHSMAASAPNNQASDRMIILGIDGMDPKLTRELMDQGRLPNFKRLAETGDFKTLMTVNPVQSPVVWSTMATGVGPGTHGIADFITRKENGYVPELSLVKRQDPSLFQRPDAIFAPPVSPKLFFWEQLVAGGTPAKVVRWPLTFPARGGATVLAGLGAPDLLGGMGTYTLFTTDPSQFPSDVKGGIVPLEFKDGKAETAIAGPKKSGLGGVSSSSVALTVRRHADGRQLTLAIGSSTWDLAPETLSPWIPLAFPIGFGNKLSGMVQFLVLSTEGAVHLYMSPIQIDPLNPAYPVSTESFGKDLAADVGRFHTLGMAEDTNALSDEVIDEDQFLKLCDGIMDDAERIFFRELDRGDPTGLYAFVFDTLDRVQHMFWRFRDPDHPLYDAVLAERYASVIPDYYVRMDGILGRLMDKIDLKKVTLMVVSDHGFTTYRRNFHVNAWLIEQGYMVLKEGFQQSEGLYRDVDWTKTRAFALGFSQIFINVEGRDARGIVPPKDVAALKAEISRRLEATTDTRDGVDVVARVYDTAKAYGMEPPLGPDLLVGTQPGYRFSWQTAVGGAPAFVFEDNDKRWSGDHCVDPEHVPGVILSNRRLAVEHPSVFDVAPTALDHFGAKRLAGMTGQNLFEVRSEHARVAP